MERTPLNCEANWRFRCGELQILDALKAIPGVSRDQCRIVICRRAQILELDETQTAECPIIDVRLGRNFVGISWELWALLEHETDALRGPKLREKFLSVMLDELNGRITQDQCFVRQSEEKRAAGLRLFVPRDGDSLGIDIARVTGASGQ